ncbi:MAG: hypothetical protein K8T26_13680 [Lentisphaerae bacterium]|nr:hypothetical protein [Lentisphaerota bacterium]
MKGTAFWTVLMAASVATAFSAGRVRAEEPTAPAKDAPWFIAKYDKDGNGQLSDEERQAANDHWQQEREKRMLKHHDKDGDGVLSDAERAEAEAAEKAYKQERLAKYDKDGDGRLSQEERAAERKDRKQKRQAAKEALTPAADVAAPAAADDGADDKAE